MSRVVAIVGPTATGKSELAVAVAQRIGGEVISADAYQIYRGLDIGTAKPTHAQRDGIPHHLIDIVEPDRSVTVAEFQSWARAAIHECHTRGVVPVLAGGSSLYVRAVLDHFEFPGTDAEVRRRWQAELDRVGPHRLHDVLAQRDPQAAEEILATNGRRIVRALEVIDLTGRPFPAGLPGFISIYDDLTMVGIEIGREDLDRRIARRVNAMWQSGWPAEAGSLAARGLAGWPTASRALGYREAMQFRSGELSREEAIDGIIAATRRFARRQQRMFRNDPRIHWVRGDGIQEALNIVIRH